MPAASRRSIIAQSAGYGPLMSGGRVGEELAHGGRRRGVDVGDAAGAAEQEVDVQVGARERLRGGAERPARVMVGGAGELADERGDARARLPEVGVVLDLDHLDP